MPTASEARADPALRRLGWVLIAGLLPVWLDTTVVNVALDNLAGDLNASPASIQWINTAYLLALAMMIPFTGWALARFGARSLWLTCLLVFLAGSILAGAAWDVTALIAFRVLQGAGGGLLMPVLQTLLVRLAGPERLGRAMATVGLPAVLVPIAGPVLGGLIVAHTSWRVVFFINVPLTLITLVLARRGLPERSDNERPAPLDALGLALVSPGLAALLYGLSQTGNPDGFASLAVLMPLAAGTVLVAAFAVVQTGLLLVPQGIGSLAVRQAVGRLTDRLGPRPVVALQWPAGFRGAFWWAFAFALAAVVPAALLPGRRP
ncbi:MFS transporter [Nonomuraea sp. NPDC046802]|uniref:MFS transporter n=1 Tax=Nonomuraea sp. NPDC046802 TaxID=3154919 RepID=UPI0033D9ED56